MASASTAGATRSSGERRPKRRNASAKDRQPSRESITEDAVPYLLRQVAGRLSRSLTGALKSFQQVANVYRVLIALERGGPATIGELAEQTLIDPSTLSRTIDRMEHERLVKHGPGGSDGRTVIVDITDSGRAFFDEILPVASAQYEWSIRGIPARDLAVLQSTLKKMLANLKVSPFK